jgi:hypothetical protein
LFNPDLIAKVRKEEDVKNTKKLVRMKTTVDE